MKKTLDFLSVINYWNAAPNYDTGYERLSYLNDLKVKLGNKLIKVIVGQRRTGKSYIIRQFIKLLVHQKGINPKNIFYLNKELFEFESIKAASDLATLISLYEETYKPDGKVYIFIDEVQNILDWEKIIVSLAQNPVKEYEVFITGSNSRLLSGELASMLSGRYLLTEVLPFTYYEYLDYFSKENTKDNFINYAATSGLPEIFHLTTIDVQRHYFQSLKDTILLKDIMHRHKIRDYVLLGDLFLFLVHNVGNMTSVPSIIKYFKSKNSKADYATISNYISYMEEAYIMHQAPRYSLKNKELLTGERKYFINDLGFRNYLYPHLTKDIGAILENLVYMHLRKDGYDIKLGYGNNYEIDFYATLNDSAQYIQVSYILASEKTIQREFGALEKVKDHFPKYVLSMDDFILSSQSGIKHEKIWEYLYRIK